MRSSFLQDSRIAGLTFRPVGNYLIAHISLVYSSSFLASHTTAHPPFPSSFIFL